MVFLISVNECYQVVLSDSDVGLGGGSTWASLSLIFLILLLFLAFRDLVPFPFAVGALLLGFLIFVAVRPLFGRPSKVS